MIFVGMPCGFGRVKTLTDTSVRTGTAMEISSPTKVSIDMTSTALDDPMHPSPGVAVIRTRNY